MAEKLPKSEIQKTTRPPQFGEAGPQSLDIQKELNDARIRELRFKNSARIGLSVFASSLLIAQNIVVFYLVYYALVLGQLHNLQVVFAALTTATLVETYFIMRIIVTFVFSSSNYD